MPLINCKIEISLNSIKNCVLTTATNANKGIFKIRDTELHILVVTLSAEDNSKLSKLLSDGFNRTVYWNKYNVIGNKIVETAANDEEKDIRELLDSSCHGIKKLFVLTYNNKEGDNKVYVDSYKNIFFQELK